MARGGARRREATVIETLRDLYGHQAWADSESWRALTALPAALEDDVVRSRLHHIHLVQRAFLSIVRGEAVAVSRPEDFPTLADLLAYAVSYHADAVPFLDGVEPARLDAEVTVPWFRDPPIRLTVAQALLQAAMHSQHHRGQNATRLRELGGAPPTTDLIVWYWKGRPEPRWP
jgi:uncharacterized damage-inducible protein DinB